MIISLRLLGVTIKRKFLKKENEKKTILNLIKKFFHNKFSK